MAVWTGHTSDPRTGARSIENWPVSEIAVGPFQPQNSWTFFQILQWKDKSIIMLHVFNSPGRSDSDENDVRDEEYVEVEDMGHRASEREQRESKPRTDAGQKERRTQWKTVHDSHLYQKT